MSNKRFICYVLAFCASLVCSLFALLYVYDPLQIFHKPYFGKAKYHDEMRLGARGIIDYYNADSYFIGTSMLRNSSSKEANEKLGGKWINISPAASSIKERYIILNYLFKKRQVKDIVYSIDGLNDEVEKKPDFVPLYDDDFLNDFSVYFNDRFIICALTLGLSKKCKLKNDVETATFWINEKGAINRLGGFDRWIKDNPDELKKYKLMELKPVVYDLSDEENKKEVLKNKEIAIKSLQNYTLSLIKQHPQTKFHLIIPPYSRFNFYVYNTSYIERKEIIKWLLLQTKDLENVTIYGFDDLSYADNIAKYAGDVVHYADDMNSMQIEAIRDRTHIITLENVDAYFKAMEDKIKAYDITPLLEMYKSSDVFKRHYPNYLKP